MNTEQLSQLLEAVQRGDVKVEHALMQLRSEPNTELDFASLDHGRALRTGVPEVIFCQGKTAPQVVSIFGQLLQHEGRALATRATPDLAGAVLQAFPQATYHEAARIIAAGFSAPACSAATRYAAVACAGTTDIPVAEEAALTVEFLGHCVQRAYDVGVAGIHRLFRNATS